jgi:hypothetical protein
VYGEVYGNLYEAALVVGFGQMKNLGTMRTDGRICNLKYKNYGLEMVLEYRNKVL